MKNLVANVRRQKLFAPGETVVVAVSGGADSVALLDLLVRLETERLRLVVAHLNHGLRGDESDRDESFVSGLAAGYGLPFALRRVDVAASAKKLKLSLEEAGRRERYAFFAETAAIHGAASIALAHHLDDQAETVLIRLLRGAGGSGLSAMGSSSADNLKRPLLQICRADIERYLAARGLSFRTDASNADTAILRNSIRHELIPFLRRYNPKISQRLAATAEILGCDEELLEQLTETAYGRIARREPGSITLPIAALSGEPRGLRLRLYRRSLAELRGDLRHIGLAHLESIDRLIASGRPNARLKLPGDCVVARIYGQMSFRLVEASAGPEWQTSIAGEGSHLLASGDLLLVQRVPCPAELAPESRKIAFLDPERAPFPWLLRGFLPGDRFTPLGMSGAQKVKDLFMNEKIPQHERRRVPLLVSAGRILWVSGMRMGEHARVADRRASVLRVEILDITT